MKRVPKKKLMKKTKNTAQIKGIKRVVKITIKVVKNLKFKNKEIDDFNSAEML